MGCRNRSDCYFASRFADQIWYCRTAHSGCFGKYEGTPRDGAEFRISKTHFADRYDGGESMMQLAQRIYNLLDELRQDENKTYLLVAHNGIARVK